MLNFLTRLLILGFLIASTNAANSICLENGTALARVPKTKTRQVIKKPTGIFKFFKKTKVYTDQYADYDDLIETDVIEGCCDGYIMSEAKECKPLCTNGCPRNAQCIKPDQCECNKDYVTAISPLDGSHYCQPICHGDCPNNAHCAEPNVCECERGYHKVDFSCQPTCAGGCEFGGVCILPDQCQCQEGYAAEYGSCVPICTAGDGCRNGRCVDKEQCVCNAGYILIPETQLCESCTDGEDCLKTIDDRAPIATTIRTQTTETFTGIDEDYKKNLDKNEKIFLLAVSSTETPTEQQCPPNFIWYENNCRPQMFASNENDCRFKACPEHAYCHANGTCACIEGFAWFTDKNLFTTETASTPSESESASESEPESPSSTSTSTPSTTIPTTPPNEAKVCMTLAEITEHMHRHKLTEIDEYSDIDWMNAFFITLGVICMLGALCYLLMRILRPVKGDMDVEAKNNLQCSYDNRNCSDSHYVL